MALFLIIAARQDTYVANGAALLIIGTEDRTVSDVAPRVIAT